MSYTAKSDRLETRILGFFPSPGRGLEERILKLSATERGCSLRRYVRIELSPLLIQRVGGHRFAGSAVPVAGVAQVSLLAMKVGMNPVPVDGTGTLANIVRLMPVAFGVPP